jgi:hypothetical protein
VKLRVEVDGKYRHTIKLDLEETVWITFNFLRIGSGGGLL